MEIGLIVFLGIIILFFYLWLRVDEIKSPFWNSFWHNMCIAVTICFSGMFILVEDFTLVEISDFFNRVLFHLVT